MKSNIKKAIFYDVLEELPVGLSDKDKNSIEQTLKKCLKQSEFSTSTLNETIRSLTELFNILGEIISKENYDFSEFVYEIINNFEELLNSSPRFTRFVRFHINQEYEELVRAAKKFLEKTNENLRNYVLIKLITYPAFFIKPLSNASTPVFEKRVLEIAGILEQNSICNIFTEELKKLYPSDKRLFEYMWGYHNTMSITEQKRWTFHAAPLHNNKLQILMYLTFADIILKRKNSPELYFRNPLITILDNDNPMMALVRRTEPTQFNRLVNIWYNLFWFIHFVVDEPLDFNFGFFELYKNRIQMKKNYFAMITAALHYATDAAILLDVRAMYKILEIIELNEPENFSPGAKYSSVIVALSHYFRFLDKKVECTTEYKENMGKVLLPKIIKISPNVSQTFFINAYKIFKKYITDDDLEYVLIRKPSIINQMTNNSVPPTVALKVRMRGVNLRPDVLKLST